MAGRYQGEKDIHESGEDYLEAILMLRQEQGHAYAIDVARRLDVSKASVSKALSKLEDRGYLELSGRDIQLTDSGLAIAERILARHHFFTRLLEDAGVDPLRAAEEACHMEHTISEESFQKLSARHDSI